MNSGPYLLIRRDDNTQDTVVDRFPTVQAAYTQMVLRGIGYYIARMIEARVTE